MSKKIIIQKFGGTSVGSIDKIKQVAEIIADSAKDNIILVVVSAIGNTTDKLLAKALEITHPKSIEELSELDTILSAGEQISIGLLSLALRKNGLKAKSYLGWQLPIITDNSFSEGKIIDIKLENIKNSLENNEIPVIAGFQGICNGRITTLGRGGSDTTAVTIAGALQAKCEIYTDVDGVYTADPRIVSRARRLEYLSYSEILEMASSGAKVLHPRAAAIAMRYRIDVRILSTFIKNNLNSGTTLVLKRNYMETNSITAVISDNNLTKITLCNINIKNKTNILTKIIENINECNIVIDHIFHQENSTSHKSDFTLIFDNDHLLRIQSVLESMKNKYYDEIIILKNIASISIIGIGIGNNLSIISKIFLILNENNIKINSFTTSETKIILLIDAFNSEIAVRTLHSGLDLDLTMSNIDK
ncbi:aspartate kinase [Lyticum sinuosum]|uniref:Aspartokinase n=1 Tax=Lyticum sinuosum TaxID=1332059 RepID=A0AAE4VL33_9RICK|nr:aspartate kinase [Lyticum sinuosum]MDZ5761107.1 Aspartokinase III [Lyticum sinuosum]